MNQSIRVEQAQKSKRLIALAIDLVTIAVSTFALFFLMLYAVIGPMFNYSSRVETIKKDRETYELNLSSKESYDKYEAVIQKFYFEYFHLGGSRKRFCRGFFSLILLRYH